ncbi:MAG: hypothetical protein AB8Y91_02920 [Coxiella endosymbiont of Haemaphysalis japonica]
MWYKDDGDYNRTYPWDARTIIIASQLVEIKEEKAGFEVSPCISNKLIRSINNSGISYLTDITTPSNLLIIRHDFHFMRFFLVALNRDIEALQTFMSIYLIIRFCPTGWIKPHNTTEYFSVIYIGRQLMISFKRPHYEKQSLN